MNYLVVNPHEARFISWRDNVPALATFDLGPDFALTGFNPITKTAGLIRGSDPQRIEQFLRSLLSPELKDSFSPLQVRIVGGQDTVACQEQLKGIVASIGEVDAGEDIIDIVSADINEKMHPESFKLMSFDGFIGSIDQ